MSDPGAVPIDPANADQLRIWNTDDGAFWAANADQFEQSTSVFRAALSEAARVRPSDHVLDVGCGTGEDSCEAARRANAGAVLGVDLSGPMLAQARDRAEAAGLDNVEFVAGDAQIYPFDPESYDVVISRMAVMFLADPLAAFANLARALRTTGRLVVMVWQAPADNEWTRAIIGAVTAELPASEPPAPGTPGPFALADPVRAGALLQAAGFRDLVTTPVTGPLWFGSGVEDALNFLTGFGAPKYVLSQSDDAAGNRLRSRLRAVLEEHVTSTGVTLDAAAWIYSARR